MSAAMIAIMASRAAAARESILARFRIADATRPERAQSLDALEITTTSTLEEFVRTGAVREARPGTFYLDEATVAALAKARPKKARIVVLVCLAVLAAIMIAVLVTINPNR